MDGQENKEMTQQEKNAQLIREHKEQKEKTATEQKKPDEKPAAEQKKPRTRAGKLTDEEKAKIENDVKKFLEGKDLAEIKEIKAVLEKLETKKRNGGKESRIEKAKRELKEAESVIRTLRKISAKKRTPSQEAELAEAIYKKSLAGKKIFAVETERYKELAVIGKKEALCKNLTENGIETENQIKVILRYIKATKPELMPGKK
jgi:hypothetical protein